MNYNRFHFSLILVFICALSVYSCSTPQAVVMQVSPVVTSSLPQPGTLPAVTEPPLPSTSPVRPLLPADTSRQVRLIRVNEYISVATGFGNTLLVTTPDGNVVIDTSSRGVATRHQQLLRGVNSSPVKFIILTHAHGDHAGGVGLWKESGTKVIAQSEHVEFLNYHARLNGFLGKRSGAQFESGGSSTGATEPMADILFEREYSFELGGIRFELLHTPGETPDHLTAWIPGYKAAFIGDNYYQSFPNLYTLRGTKPRWALDYVNSLNKVLELKPEIVLPSHGEPIRRNTEIVKTLTRYRDAVQYVHDATVKGMNEGKDVYSLMREIKLPPELEVGESYGRVSWSVRGIYEGYAGWFDTNPATMYDVPPEAIYPYLIELIDDPEKVLKLAREKLESGEKPLALRLIDVVLSAHPESRNALELRLEVLQRLLLDCGNSNERGWLNYDVMDTKLKLKK